MEIARHWRLKDQRYRLIGLQNKITGEVEFPPKANLEKNTIFSSSRLPSYTLGSYTEEPKIIPQMQELRHHIEHQPV